jgi:hypothetical protein
MLGILCVRGFSTIWPNYFFIHDFRLVRLSSFGEIASVPGERWASTHRFFRGY